MGLSILLSVHGKLGPIFLLIAVIQIIPSLVFKNRARYRGLHKILGYSLALILVIDATGACKIQCWKDWDGGLR